jgi:Coenzyme PQQ synthesis protein D (PqqD)
VSARFTIGDSVIVAIARDVLGSEIGSEVVMLNLRDGTYYGLDDVGAEIWRLIQTPTTIDRVVTALVDMYDVDTHRCRADAIALLENLAERGLVEVRNSR